MTSKNWPRLPRKKSSDSVKPASHCRCDDGDDRTLPESSTYLDDHLPEEYFRQDLINLIHEMRMPGWSIVTLDMASDLDLVRISGATSNSVYWVKPPDYVKNMLKKDKSHTHRKPTNLLLRIYGLQIEHLIDRQQELATIAELSQLHIGPRLLGTFANGRFEQFLNAKPLTKEQMRAPEVSVQIARRMRELHDRVPLSPEMRAEGACCFRNIKNWSVLAQDHLKHFEKKFPGITSQLMNYKYEDLDEREAESGLLPTPNSDIDYKNPELLSSKLNMDKLQQPDPSVKKHTFPEFLDLINKYSELMKQKYKDEELVFCHNDTQYGNILRLEPPKGSPLLQPQNEYRQLVVIDFEYSGPNPRAFDIANHFCEWMNDYHHAEVPHHIWRNRYPPLADMELFVQAYVEHGERYFDDNKIAEQVDNLMKQIKDWTPIVNACWGLWGVVQMPTDEEYHIREEHIEKDPNYILTNAIASPSLEPEETSEFDYFGYASQKMSLFYHNLSEFS
ncbi:bifunctional choline kinase/ethanolamine kinase [Starmerella bacillaris]|uniref:Bifunctional choline kinase/ethanolamine kinase n=1 Tax=Starmerella bacillaris TaxID=1247836 RepID=A0AAV5REP5_STABA|nr:bifunctional choline kinase/ethanolamine kinase [Starmerella bacillaris]